MKYRLLTVQHIANSDSVRLEIRNNEYNHKLCPLYA